MTPKQVTTDATKAQLPRPRKRTPKAAPPVPCMDWPADSLPSGEAHYIPPDAAPFPWPFRLRTWADNALFWTRQRLANGLRRMAARVAP